MNEELQALNVFSVYVKLNKNNEIVAVNSSAFLENTDGYIKIDEGLGDKYMHAQGNYLEKPLFTDDANLRYRYENEEIVDQEEKRDKLAELETPNGEKISSNADDESHLEGNDGQT